MVSAGKRLVVSHLGIPAGKQFYLPSLLLLTDSTLLTSQADLKNTIVTASALQQVRTLKLQVWKFRRRKNYKRRATHQQNVTQLLVGSLRILQP